MSTNRSTTLDPAARRALAVNPEIGAGNFLRHAAAANPARDEPILFLERPWRTFRGVNVASFSLSSILATADEYAAWYHQAGVRAKDVVAVYLDDSAAFLIHFVALTSLGAIPALTNGAMPPAVAAGHFQRIGAVGLYTDAAHAAVLPSLGGLQFLVTDEKLEQSFGEQKPLAALPERYPFVHDALDPIMIAHSSGTTGIPKPVLLQHKAFFHGVRYRLSQPPAPGGERILSSLPHSHNCAIAYIMLALLNGTPVLILSDHSGKNIVAQAAAWRPTMVVSFPQTFVEVAEAAPKAGELSSVTLWMNGGDAAHEAHIRALLAAAPGSRFIDGMGSSEMGFSLFRHVHSESTDHYRRCVGKPHDWVEAAVLGGDGEILPPHAVGRLGVKAPSVTTGYWNDSALTHRTRLSGYWLTGDLVFRDEEGWFYHVDRVPDVVRTDQGPLYSLETEELLLRHVPDISDVAVFAKRRLHGGEEALALVRLKTGSEPAAPAALLDVCNSVLARLGKPLLAGVELTDQARVPLGATGKVLKRQLRDAYAEGAPAHG